MLSTNKIKYSFFFYINQSFLTLPVYPSPIKKKEITFFLSFYRSNLPTTTILISSVNAVVVVDDR
jgi:hypothetical protein